MLTVRWQFIAGTPSRDSVEDWQLEDRVIKRNPSAIQILSFATLA